jgi:hypothetical protein
MDVATLMAKQVRIERQDTPNVSAVSFDRFAAHSFQAYVQSALAFSIKRCGLLYGRLDDDKVVFVDAVYEPEQQGKAETITYDFSNEQVTSSCTCDAIWAAYAPSCTLATGAASKQAPGSSKRTHAESVLPCRHRKQTQSQACSGYSG